MSAEWMLLQTLGAEPTVIAIGSQARHLVPLCALLGRNRHRHVIETAIAECRRTGQKTVAKTPAGDRTIQVFPVAISETQVHGVQVWFGPTAEQPPSRPIAGAGFVNRDTWISTVTTDYLDVIGVDPRHHSDRRSITEELAALVPSAHDVEIFANMVNPEPETTFSGTCPIRDCEGRIFDIVYAGRAFAESTDHGSPQQITRVLCMRVDRQDALPPAGLAQHILSAVSMPGVHRMLINIENLAILRWIDEPLPGMAWRYDPHHLENVHPDDIHQVEKMLAELKKGSTRGVLRFRATAGGWLTVDVTATKFALRPNAFAAIVALSAIGTHTI